VNFVDRRALPVCLWVWVGPKKRGGIPASSVEGGRFLDFLVGLGNDPRKGEGTTAGAKVK